MKQKYKVSWSVFNLFAETQKEVVKLQGYAKAFFGTGVIVTWMETNANAALIVGGAAALIDTAIACFSFEPIKNENETA